MARRMLKNVALIAGLAAAAGYVTGLLTAPKSGKQTRADIKHAAKQGVSSAERQLKTLSTELNQAVDDAIAMGQEARGRANDKLTELTEQAQQARSKVREVISAVHDGSASDEDLDTAVKQATYALRHLRDYLKK